MDRPSGTWRIRSAADTAKYISRETGIPARVEQRLKEQNFGKYEGTARNGEEYAAFGIRNCEVREYSFVGKNDRKGIFIH